MERIREIVEGTDTALGRAVDLGIQLLIVMSTIAFTIDTLPNLSQNTRKYLDAFEVATIAIFTLEYTARLFVAKKKLKYMFSFFGVIDLLAILPFFFALGIDLRTLRILRLLRLVRIFKLARYSQAVRRFHRALRIAKEEFLLYLFATVLLLYLAAVGIYYCEHEAQPEVFASVVHSLWWAVATLTTVGYGDVFPVTAGGKFFTFLVLIVGLGVVSFPAGLLASALSRAREMDDDMA